MEHPYDFRVINLYNDASWDPVIDGDTVDVVIDQGFFDSTVIRIRVVGPAEAELDTPEVYGRYASAKGEEAKEFTRGWLLDKLTIGRLRLESFADPERDRPVPDGGFGRWAGNFYDIEDPEDNLYAALTEAGYNEDE